MKQTHILFDDPGHYPMHHPYPFKGSSPKFINALKDFLYTYAKKIKSLQIALYLFNNLELHHLFQELAQQGIEINVVSIPLEGYDNTSPQKILKEDGSEAFKDKKTKYDLATIIYKSFPREANNYRLFLFPHTYIRSHRIKSFSRGKIPYSLHIKSLLIEFHSGDYISGIFSSNLAVRDAIKHDTFVLYPINKNEAITHVDFFRHLIENSVPVTEYEEPSNMINTAITIKKQSESSSVHFIAPFYWNSPEKAQQIILELIEKAQHRIWIVGQHISAYTYNIPLNYKVKTETNSKISKKGFLFQVVQKGKIGLDIQCISQTYSGNQDTNRNFRQAANKHSFSQFTEAFKKVPNAAYFVNPKVHSKYIIIDDKVIITTFNYTPTQFIYLPYVEINNFEHINNLQYRGIFSEVGQMKILEKKSDCECFVRNFEFLKTREETIQVI